MDSIYKFNSYKKYLKHAISQYPKQGRGQINKLADYIRVHPTLVSLVLNFKRDLSLEQIHRAGEFLGLKNLEFEYFITLGLFEKAGSKDLEDYFQKKLKKIIAASTKVSQQFEDYKEIGEEEQAIFYSSWYYVAIWLYCSLGDGQSIESIAKKFKISNDLAGDYLSFLIKIGLCKKNGSKYELGGRHIHLEKGSKMLPHYHAMWRLQGVQKSHKLTDEELMFTAPLTISKSDFAKLKDELLKVIKKGEGIVKNSTAEELACLNLDLYWIESENS